MSIGAIGSVIFVNQQTASVAPFVGNQNNRFDLQNIAAQAAVNEKDEMVLEVRATEENHEIDADREHQREEADQETARGKKRNVKSDEDNGQETATKTHRLDIKV